MKRILNIAVDARPFESPDSGMGRYLGDLLHEFASDRVPHRFFLYSARPFQLRFPLPEHWKIRIGSLRCRGSHMAIRHFFFPVWSLKDRIDVFWSPCHQLPLFLPPCSRKVLTVHDVAWKRFPETVSRRYLVYESLLLPASLRIADQVITDSHFACSEILSYFPGARNKIDFIYLASNLKTDGATGSCQLSNPYFLFVGSSEPRKNLERMLVAYGQYRKLSLHPIDLVLAGGYRWGNFSVKDFIGVNNLQSSVHSIENADDTVLRALYANAQALVLVSLYEGFGLPLVEAMQWSIPLIASNTSSVAEIAGDAGLLVDPYNTDEIAQAFKRIAEDDAFRRALGEQARLRGVLFSWKKAASETMALLVGDPTLAK